MTHHTTHELLILNLCEPPWDQQMMGLLLLLLSHHICIQMNERRDGIEARRFRMKSYAMRVGRHRSGILLDEH